ncbi:MAG: O-antigen ligase family protein [Candidatus Omnitrophica bacterium]|jgi:tetratricopeptide (TPR) repeat protein|nr:O-antigen ligase family protein [Candidatus Omnitrophota bacterium]
MKNIEKQIKKIDIFRLLLPVVFFGLAALVNFDYEYNYTLIKAVIGALFISLVFIYYLYKKRESFEFDRLTFLAGSAFFVWVLIGCFYAPYKYAAAKYLDDYLLYFLLFLVGLTWEWTPQDAVIWSISAVIACIIGIIEAITPPKYPISMFGNPDFFAGFLIMPAFLAFYFLIKKWNVYGAIYLLLTFITLLIVKTRSTLGAYVVGIIFVLFIIYRRKKPSYIKWIGFVAGIVGFAILFPSIELKFLHNIRYYIWRGTWKMIIAKPFLGWGTGNFMNFYPYFRYRPYFLKPEATPLTNHPHNLYLELWSQHGIIGLILFIAVVVIALSACLRNKKYEELKWTIFIIPAIIGVIIDNILSINMANPSTAMFFWFLIGSAAAMGGKKYYFPFIKNISISKIFYGILIFISLFLAVWTTYYNIIPDIYLKKAIAYRDMGFYRSSVKNYKKAWQIDTYDVVAYYKMAYAYAQMGEYKKALGMYKFINNTLFPHFAQTDENIGILYMNLHNIQKAKKYFKTALWFDPYNVNVLNSLASINIIYYNNKKKAIEYLEKVIKIKPKDRYANFVLNKFQKLGIIGNNRRIKK